MATLNYSDKLKLERLFRMESGYVLDFSNRTFQEFVFSSVQKDIYHKKYSYRGGSKANRLRAFWEQESDSIVGKLISDLLEYWKTKTLLNNERIEEGKNKLYEECKKIANRLLGIPQINQRIITEDVFLNQEFEEIQLNKLGLDSSITEILSQRIDEIKKCLNAKASLAVIFLCGSTLEGILLGIAKKMPKEFNSSTSSPKKDGKVLQFQDWTLANFIDVAHSIGLLGEDVKKFSHVLRDFRNYIHPYQQQVSKFKPDEHTAKICWQVLQAAIFQLLKIMVR
ncbi:MAG: hypothetical protein ACPLW7_03120 [Minisyncoccia bacterium]|uniref:Abortive infection protein-like C-terminal domain-containing protein n=1 Tax=Thermodesulfovibrio obliviosus TaxID=3118332 RepID=A0AAU8H0W0_9BACT